MQYFPTSAFHAFDRRLIAEKLRYFPHAVLAAAALLGLGTHHALLVAVGLIAVLAFQHRVAGVAPTRSPAPPGESAHGEGGSFPGSEPESVSARTAQPKVLDGGSLEHRRNGR
jgi:hypothetical protein